MKRRLVIPLAIFTLIIALVLIIAVRLEGAPDEGFPIMRITSEYNPFTMPREQWHDGTISLEGEGRSFRNVDVRLRGRGNSTWWFGEEKRPLRLRFNPPRELLGSGTAHRDWVMLANHFDRSLLRNHTALHLGSLLSGLDNTPRSFFVHLYINEHYVGVYQITDERNLDVGRTSLVLDPDPAISEYMLELDGRMRESPEEKWITWVDVNGIPYEIRFPSDDISTDAHVEYVYNYLTSISLALRTGDFDALKGLIDIPSFVDFFLVQEFVKNPDVGWSSVFMTIRGQGDERRLYMGPLWDFDLAMGNSSYPAPNLWAAEMEQGYSPYGLMAVIRNYWFANAMQIPEFAEIVANRWHEISENEIYQTIRHIEDIASRYATDFERNFEAHQIMGTLHWQEPQEIIDILTFEGQAAHLVNWLERRAEWLNDHFSRVLNDPARFVPPRITVDGVVLETDVHPLILSGTMLGPVGVIANALDAEVTWDGENRIVTLYHPDGTRAIMTIGDTAVIITRPGRNEEVVNLATAAMIISGRTFVPIRFFAGFFGVDVDWDESTRTAVITRPH